MNIATRILGSINKGLFRKSNIFGVVAVVCVVFGAVVIEQKNNAAHYRHKSVEVNLKLDEVNAALENNLNSKIQLGRGLVSTIATDPLMSQLRFGTLVQHLFGESTGVRLVTAARQHKISMIYPYAEYKDLFGTDYPANVSGYPRLAQTREKIIIVPPQEGTSFREISVWLPVFSYVRQGQTTFWGVVNIAIDLDQLLIESGVRNNEELDIALTGTDALSEEGAVFYGDDRIVQDTSIAETVNLSSDNWQIYATPKGGWAENAPNVWVVRALCALGGAAVLLGLWFTGVLFVDRRKQRIEFQTVSRRLEMALKASKIGVWELDVQAGELFWDRRMRELYGLPQTGEVTYEHWVERVDDEDVERVVAEIDQAIKTETLFDCYFKLRSSDGKERHIRSAGMPQFGVDGRQRVVGVNWDVSEEVKLNEQLRRAQMATEARNHELESAKTEIEKIALHDALTGLPNRRYLDQVLNELYESKNQHAALMHVDLDKFKEINDTLGHAAGDAMLEHAATVLRNCFRGTDFVGRSGGDEFVILCRGKCDTEVLARLAQRVIDQMSVPIEFEGHSCQCGASVGIASVNRSATSADQLLVDADIALYRAKNQGRNCYEFYSDELKNVAVQTRRLSDEILAGLDNDEFVAHYQGQFDAETLDISGAEALVRWEHPEKGILPPAAFMDACEELDILPRIDALVLDHALKQMKTWRKARIKVPSVSVNVSPKRLADPELTNILKSLEFEPGTLTFELVESTFLDSSSDIVNWNIEQIRARGIQIEIDDFGTGYASILGLSQLQPKMLKIDRQLVTPILESEQQKELVRSIVGIGKSLKIDAIAEGVETMEHAKVLHELGCKGLQGYALAKPMSGEDFVKFARKWARRDKTAHTVANVS